MAVLLGGLLNLCTSAAARQVAERGHALAVTCVSAAFDVLAWILTLLAVKLKWSVTLCASGGL